MLVSNSLNEPAETFLKEEEKNFHRTYIFKKNR